MVLIPHNVVLTSPPSISRTLFHLSDLVKNSPHFCISPASETIISTFSSSLWHWLLSVSSYKEHHTVFAPLVTGLFTYIDVLKFYHVVACVKFPSFLRLNNDQLYEYTVFLFVTHPSECLGCFHVLTIMNDVTGGCTHVFETLLSILLGI